MSNYWAEKGEHNSYMHKTSSGSNVDTTEEVDVQTGGQQHTKEIRSREQQNLEGGQQGPGTR